MFFTARRRERDDEIAACVAGVRTSPRETVLHAHREPRQDARRTGRVGREHDDD